MNTFSVDINTKPASVYYNSGKINLFRVHVDVTLSGLNDQLDQIKWCLNHIDTKWLEKVKYCCSSIDIDKRVWFTR